MRTPVLWISVAAILVAVAAAGAEPVDSEGMFRLAADELSGSKGKRLEAEVWHKQKELEGKPLDDDLTFVVLKARAI